LESNEFTRLLNWDQWIAPTFCSIEKIEIELLIFSFGQNINKILNIKTNICATSQMKNEWNNMQPIIHYVFTKVGWFVAKKVDLYLCDTNIKPYNWQIDIEQ
jgi:hypothetical protein